MELQDALHMIVTTIIEIIAMALVAYIALKLPPLIRAALEWLEAQVGLVRSRFTAEDLALFDATVTKIVKAVEQKGIIGEIENIASAKKAEAMSLLQAECERLGIEFDWAAADSTIEAAIKDGLQKGNPFQTISSSSIVLPERSDEIAGDSPPIPQEAIVQTWVPS